MTKVIWSSRKFKKNIVKRDGDPFWHLKYRYNSQSKLISIFFLSDFAFKALLNIHDKWICFYLTRRSTNSVFLSCTARLFTSRKSWSFSRGDRGRALSLRLPHRLTTSSKTVLRYRQPSNKHSQTTDMNKKFLFLWKSNAKMHTIDLQAINKYCTTHSLS